MPHSFKSFLLLALGITFLVACQSEEKTDNSDKPPANGKIFTALGQDDAFIIGRGNEDELVIDMLEAFNKMDAEALWEHAADSVLFRFRDGTVDTLTQADMSAYFASVDSVQWMVGALIPIEIVGGDRVSVLTDGTETIYHKNGSVEKFKLFERFIFENSKLVAVHQWEAGIKEGSE